MSLEHIFVYSEDTPVNFNVFNESRKKNYNEDPINYNVMYERVMRTYEVFFEWLSCWFRQARFIIIYIYLQVE
jgi:hypothetical protein